MLKRIGFTFSLLVVVYGQAPGSEKENVLLNLNMEECSGLGNCNKIQTKVTMDSNWRWVHNADGYDNCYSGNVWSEQYCPDAASCLENCVLEGVDSADWGSTYGDTVSGDALTLKFVTHGQYSDNMGSRVYLTAPSGDKYQMFKLLNREFTFDVDVSNLPCGLNGALYFVEMEEDGGMSKYPGDKSGAEYGTGYCDAQCPHDLKFIGGVANVDGWKPSDNDANSGKGKLGACCNEMDIWEANSQATSYTPHTCDTVGHQTCEGLDCGDNDSGDRYDGVCDKDGCDLNPWRLGDQQFYGEGSGFEVDTTKPMTVVTQFITDDGTDNGELSEIRRIFVQDGQVIEHAFTNMPGVDRTNSIDQKFCEQAKVTFGDIDDFTEHGGLRAMGESLARGHVLVMSLWDDHDANMLWLDSNYPAGKDPAIPGVSRGPCPEDSGVPSDVEEQNPDSSVVFSKIKLGTIGSTYPSDY